MKGTCSSIVSEKALQPLTNHIAVKISEESHNSVLDEIWRRDQLEYDPNLVVVSGEDEPEDEIGGVDN